MYLKAKRNEDELGGSEGETLRQQGPTLNVRRSTSNVERGRMPAEMVKGEPAGTAGPALANQRGLVIGLRRPCAWLLRRLVRQPRTTEQGKPTTNRGLIR
jgi:hypothetical protein